MEIVNGAKKYGLHGKVADTEGYRLYLCVEQATARQCLLQVAAEDKHNGALDRAAYILGELKRLSDELEEEYAQVKKDPKVMLNYDLGFPELLDSFICQEQGGRRINILAFKFVEDVSKMVPLTNIISKDRQRVDLRTSVWIMGKLLKLLVFTHSANISAGLLGGNNILIEPDQHYVQIFDWSSAKIHQDGLPVEIRCREISHAAQAVIAVLGGNYQTGVFPDDGDPGFARYTQYLLKLARGGETKVERAHAQFYELVDGLWKREFYPFAVKPLM